MFNKILLSVCLTALICVPAFALNFDEMDSQTISLKAGPSDVTEELSIAWVETALYPKNVTRGQEVFLEVKLTSRVKEVVAYLDSSQSPLPLFSDNSKDWSRVMKIPESLKGGAHLIKMVIRDAAGRAIQRSLDFVMNDPAEQAALEGVPLTVINTSIVTDKGETVRTLLPGVKVSAVTKAAFYRVRLSDGKEGWVEAQNLSDPTEELYLSGLKAFKEKDYGRAASVLGKTVEYSPDHIKARLLLVQTYFKLNEKTSAMGELKALKEIAPLNPEVAALSDSLIGNVAVRPATVVLAKKPAPMPAMANTIVVSDSVNLVKGGRTSKGTAISSALASVLSLTKSLGTKIFEDGWQVRSAGDGLRVVFNCRQERSGKVEAENFEWKLDPDTRRVTPLNDNARLLMSRW
ncbi:tetratricopeptide repeat protein [Candidatus Saganbacteria bacterium]|nr:tetratricopeptide repeat protein [Candidatus Saganbacteria bacterium]